MKKVILLMLCLALMAGSASAMVQYSGYAQGAQSASPGQYRMIPGGGGYGCGMVDPTKYPGSTEYCTKWIPGHWIQVRVMVPGRWVNRPVWIPSYPKMQQKWVPGFWQTRATNVRPDLQIWGSSQHGWFGRPYQQDSGGYFTPQGMWVPTQ